MSSAKSQRKDALAAMKAAREGVARSDQYEVPDEKEVYDQVDEDECLLRCLAFRA